MLHHIDFGRDPCGDAVKKTTTTRATECKCFWYSIRKQTVWKLTTNCSGLCRGGGGGRGYFLCQCSSFNRAVTFSESIRECRQLKRGLWIDVKRQQGSTLSCPHSPKPFPWENPAVCKFNTRNYYRSFKDVGKGSSTKFEMLPIFTTQPSGWVVNILKST